MLPVDYQGNKNVFLPREKKRIKYDYKHFAGDFVEMKTCTDVK